jgi:hypothetical protein
VSLRLALAVCALLVWPVAARAESPPSPPLSFLVTPTDQLGYPGETSGTEVSPQGDLYTGWGELTFSVGPGDDLDPITHTLAEGRFPIVHLFKVEGNLLYEEEAFQAPVAGHPVVFARISVRNLGSKSTRGRVTAAFRYSGGEQGIGLGLNRCCVVIYRFPRPRDPVLKDGTRREGLYWQDGAPFSSTSAYALQGTTLLRDGQAVALFDGGGSGIRFRQQLQTELAPFNTRSEFGRATYVVSLRPHARKDLTFAMPIPPVPPTDPVLGAIAGARYGQYRAITRRFWLGVLRGAMRVQLPERKVVNTFYASIANDLLARYVLPSSGQWVQAVNQMRYHSFYLRDSALQNEMYLLVGLPQVVRQNLDFVFTWQRNDGLFIDRAEEYDGFGEALWAMGEYVRHTGDTGFAHTALPAISKAMRWFEGQIATDPLGLMPPVQVPPDNELTTGHIAGDNFWAAAGVAAAISVAQAAGDQASAAKWQADYDAFVNNLRARVFAAQQANHGFIPPTLDNGLNGQDWGNLWAAYPWPVLDPKSVVVRRTIAHVRRKFAEGIATYFDRTVLHGWLGFRLFETELLQGKQKNVVDGLYAELAHTTGSNAGFESSVAPYGDRVVDDTTVPHGAWAAEYATLLRNMLVREAGGSIYLMSAVSPNWLGGGKRISVGHAPTVHGPVSFTLTSSASGATLRWSGPAGLRYVWPVPYLARGVRAAGLNRRTGQIVLRGQSGTLHVRWRLVGTPPSFERTFRGLMIAYLNSANGQARLARARGQLPIVGSLRQP